MTRSGMTVGAAAAAFALAMSVNGAMAGPCGPSNLSGKWQLYALPGTGSPFRCSFTVGLTGLTTGSCLFSGNNTPKPVSNGSLKMTGSATCTVTGNFTVNGVAYTVKHVTLAQDFNTAAGGASFPPNNGVALHFVRLP